MYIYMIDSGISLLHILSIRYMKYGVRVHPGLDLKYLLPDLDQEISELLDSVVTASDPLIHI